MKNWEEYKNKTKKNYNQFNEWMNKNKIFYFFKRIQFKIGEKNKNHFDI